MVQAARLAVEPAGGGPVQHLFDQFAKALARPQSRREVLRQVGSLLGLSTLMALGILSPADASNAANCAEVCGNVPPGKARKKCLQHCKACPKKRPGCLTDSEHPNKIVCCGRNLKCCGHECCPTEQECCNNLCCAPGTSCCPTGECANLSNDEANCGACGVTCGVNELCCNGACRNIKTDEMNCGGCGIVCSGFQVCVNGQCTTPMC